MGLGESACEASSNHSDVVRGDKSYPATLRFIPGVKRDFGYKIFQKLLFFDFYPLSIYLTGCKIDYSDQKAENCIHFAPISLKYDFGINE